MFQAPELVGLVDVPLVAGPGGGLALPGAPLRAVDAAEIAERVRPGHDVRVLADDGARHSALLTELAGLIGADVLTTAAGAAVRVTEAGAIAVNAAGRPVDWLLIRPPGVPALPGFFDLRDGAVLARTGPVTIGLPDGLVLTTRSGFHAGRSTAARLRRSHPGLHTVAVTLAGGGFLVGDFQGREHVYAGSAFAGVLADLPLYGADLRLWLRWLPSEPDRRELVRHLSQLADCTGATVWSPPMGGSAEPSGDLFALGPDGHPGRWRSFPPDGDTATPRFGSAPDGRLLPILDLIFAADEPAQ